jgi:glycosyltransferase involved in cell wall biosynthesis
MLRDADAIHYTSEQERRNALPIVRHDRSAVISLGLDLTPFRQPRDPGGFRRRHPDLADKKILLFFGRLHHKKGLDLLAEALPDIVRAVPTTRLIFAGPDNGMEGKLKARFEQQGMTEYTRFLGTITGEEKYELLHDSDLFVLPSYTENFGISVVEALAAGTPVVISEEVGIWREVKSARVGSIVKCDAHAAANACIDLLSDLEKRRSYGARAPEFVARTFNWDVIGEQLLELYRNISALKKAA